MLFVLLCHTTRSEFSWKLILTCFLCREIKEYFENSYDLYETLFTALNGKQNNTSFVDPRRFSAAAGFNFCLLHDAFQKCFFMGSCLKFLLCHQIQKLNHCLFRWAIAFYSVPDWNACRGLFSIDSHVETYKLLNFSCPLLSISLC